MRRPAGPLLLILGSVAATVALLEVALRVAGVSYGSFYTRDMHTGAALRPGAAGRWPAEGNLFVRISGEGLRDREHGTAKPPGTVRIAVLGDSYVEALQVPPEHNFLAVMERELATCLAPSGRRAEAINFGVSGYGTAQELLALKHRAWRFSPDVVVLAVTTANDIRNNSRALENDPDRPYFVLRGDALVLDNSFLSSWKYRPAWRALYGAASRLVDRSRVLQVANQAKNVYLSRRAALRQEAAAKVAAASRLPPAAPQAGDPPLAAAPPPGAEAGLDDMIYREPADPAWTEAWRVTERLIEAMDDEVKARGASLLVVTLSNGIQVHPDSARRAAYARRIGAPDLFFPERRIGALCERKGIAFLSLAPPFREHAEAHNVHLHGFGANLGAGHWNRDGHALAGRLVARAVCEELGNRKPAGR
jgi:hypothetical protein